MWSARFEHERAVGEFAVARGVKQSLAPDREPFPMQLCVDRVRSGLALVQLHHTALNRL